MIIQRQEVDQDLTNKLKKIELERQSLVEQLSVAERQLASLQLEKYDVEKTASRLEKDKMSLIKSLDKVSYHIILPADLRQAYINFQRFKLLKTLLFRVLRSRHVIC